MTIRQFGVFFHTDETRMRSQFLMDLIDIEPNAIVANFKFQDLIFARQLKLNAGATTMAVDIVGCLLNNAVDNQFQFWRYVRFSRG